MRISSRRPRSAMNMSRFSTCTCFLKSPTQKTPNLLTITRYRQNPGVKQTLGESGQIMTVNTQQTARVRTHLVSYDIPEVPSKPEASLPPIETLDSSLRATIDLVAALFEKRPAWTRRAIRNHLKNDEQRYLLRHAVPYIGYIFRSGPWRDAIIKLGHDPRSSPEYRHYQTFMFRILPRESEPTRPTGGGRRHNNARTDVDVRSEFENRTTGTESYIFTGRLPIPRDGRIWMACDIHDPLLHNILYPPEDHETDSKNKPSHLRSTCEIVTSGWFGNGTIAKVKTIMRAKVQSLIEGREPDDADFRQIVNLPDFAESDADIAARFQVDPEISSAREISLATEVRAAIKSAPQWRQTTEKDRQGQERKGRGAAQLKKGVEADGEDGNDEEMESEGEEEEMERVEMLEEQVAAALAARDAEEENAYDVENENDNADMDDNE